MTFEACPVVNLGARSQFGLVANPPLLGKLMKRQSALELRGRDNSPLVDPGSTLNVGEHVAQFALGLPLTDRPE